MIEDTYQKLKLDLAQLVMHWRKLAEHIKQKPLARKVLQDVSRELEAVLNRD